MQGAFKYDGSKFAAAVRKLTSLPSSKPMQDTMRMAAGQVVKKVIEVTPPASGKADSAAKKRGENAILGDLGKVFVAAAKRLEKEQELPDPETIYRAQRNPRTGHLTRSSRGASGRFQKAEAKIAVKKAALVALKKKLLAQVGSLAAGWNAAAEELKVKVPAWISRHGNKYGVIRVKVTETGIRITLGNDVAFVDNIEDLPRRLQWALDTVGANIIEKQVPAIVRRLAKSAGFKA